MSRRFRVQDPYWTTARYAGTAPDGAPIRKGDRIFYYPNTRTALIGELAEQAAREFATYAADEKWGAL